ncbi:MAG: hypothetical protein R2867_42210 [Caldilineaceae bacterium]
MNNTEFSQLPQNVQYAAMRQCWPGDWRKERTLTTTERAELDSKLAAFAERYQRNVTLVTAHRAMMAERAQCPCFTAKPLAERRAILAEMKERVRR